MTTRKDWLIAASLIALALVPAIAGTARVAQLANGAPAGPDDARFFASPLPVLLHVPAAILYSILGALQFPPGLRRAHRPWHRAAGRLLLPAAFVVALSGLWMTVSYPWPPWDGAAVYVERLVVGTAMLAWLVLGVDAIRRRDFAAHGRWMIRAYALGMGAGTQVLTHLPWFIFREGMPGGLPRAIMMGGAWVLNAAVAEWIIRKPHLRRAPALAPAT